MTKIVTVVQTVVTWTAVRQWKANLHFPEVTQDNTELTTVCSRKETRTQAWWTYSKRSQNASTVGEWATMAILV
jgi:hypothetical protein